MSPTFGAVSMERLRKIVLGFMEDDQNTHYQLIIGTDSQCKNGSGVDFVTAIVVHREGSGGIYFWKRELNRTKMVLKTRIYQEAIMSITSAQEVLELFKKDGITRYDMEIHVDIGTVGATRELITEVVGMIRGSGFSVRTKPDSYVASKVADRYT